MEPIDPLDYENADEIDKDPLEMYLDVQECYGCKPCYVELERCDKIWETLELIKHLQDGADDQSAIVSDENSEELDVGTEAIDQGDVAAVLPLSLSTETTVENESELVTTDSESQSSSSQTNLGVPYIKYQPVLNNGNSSLPNFQFSVMSKRLLYQCHVCGKQYSHRSSLREHSKIVHKIILPPPAKRINDFKYYKSDTEDDIDIKNEMVKDEEYEESDSETSDKLLQELKKNIISCSICHREFKIKKYLRRHQRLVHGIFVRKRKIDDVNSIDNNNKKEETEIKSKTNEIASKIIQRVRKIGNTNRLNSHRCKTCGKHFHLFEKLREHAKTVHGVNVRYTVNVRSLIKTNANRCNNNNNNNENKVKEKLIKKSPVKSDETEEVDNVKKKKSEIPDNKKRKINPFNPFYNINSNTPKCPVTNCNLTFNDYQSWKNHLSKFHRTKVAHKNIYPIETLNGDIKNDKTCSICLKELIDYQSSIEHMISVHKKVTLKCEYCDVKCSNIDNFVKHVFQYHKILFYIRHNNNPRRKHMCLYCGSRYTDKKYLNLHSLYVHGCKPKSPSKCLPKNSNEKQTAVDKKFKNIKSFNEEEESKPPEKLKSSSSSSSSSSTSSSSTSAAPPAPTTSSSSSKVKKSTAKAPIKTNQNQNVTIKKEIPSIADLKNDATIVCFLCNRRCTQIKKHFIDYHKINNPEALIAQCKSLSLTSLDTETDSNESKTKNIEVKPAPKSIVQNTRIAVTKAKKIFERSPASHPVPKDTNLFELFQSRSKKFFYKCNSCNATSFKYRSMLNHERKHIKENKKKKPNKPSIKTEDSQPAVTIKSENKTSSSKVIVNSKPTPPPAPVNSRKRKRESTDEPIAQRPRLSTASPLPSPSPSPLLVNPVSIRTTRTSVKVRQEMETSTSENDQQSVTPKPGSSLLISDDNSSNSTNDLQENSDKDSGIGISITIKKKNDSYEIVNRDDYEDGKLPLPDIKPGLLNNNSKKPGDIVLKYSKDHKIMKIEKSNDDDIDIDMDDFSENIFPSLRQLCRKFLDKNKMIYNPSRCYNEVKPLICYDCGTVWTNIYSLSGHRKIHKR